jgi:hypothetical protein
LRFRRHKKKKYNCWGAQMTEGAQALGQPLITKEIALDILFSTTAANEKSLAELVLQIADLQGKLRLTHLMYYLRTKNILSVAQINRYDELRDYGEHSSGHNHNERVH